MNRQHRKAIKMAKRHKRGIWSPARNPFWQAQPQTPEALRVAMRSIYNQCSAGTEGTTPEHAVVSGELVNLALGTNDHDPNAAYHVGPNGIERLTE